MHGANSPYGTEVGIFT